MYQIKLITVDASDQAELTKMQKKINNWITTKLLKKYEIHPSGNNIVFNVCLKKSA